MKKIVIAVFIGFTLLGCTDKKTQEKALLDEVIKVHDKVMDGDEQLMKNKMRLDTLVKNSTASEKDSAVVYVKLLDNAENSMDDWMHKFNPDQTGKSHDETMAYLGSQKKQIMAIDSQLNAAINESNKYLLKVKSK